MNFSDCTFIFVFLPLFLLIYGLLKKESAKFLVRIIASIVFYEAATWSNAPFAVLFLLSSVTLNFGLYKWMRSLYEKNGRGAAKALLILILSLNIGTLIYCKLIGHMLLGISFYTFTMIALQVDLYRDESLKLNYVNYIAYALDFTRLTMGPIARYKDFNTFTDEYPGRLTAAGLNSGLKDFTVGLAFKVLLADNLATLWNSICVSGPDGISVSVAWLGAVTYTLELYFDFWGYTLMVKGLAGAIGYNMPNNFNHPYVSKTVSEFWRRWHITLGAFFRDYVYIPLGGNRKGSLRTVLNLFIVWLLTGIWHGNGWNFLLWGLFLFTMIFLERFTPLSKLKDTKVLGHIYILVLMPISWMFFANTDLSTMGAYIGRLFGMKGENTLPAAGQFLRYINTYWYLLTSGALLITPYPAMFYKKYKDTWWFSILLLILFWGAVYSGFINEGNTFLYYQF